MISRKSLYAMHALIYVAENEKLKVQVNWIAKAKKIPRKFLEVIMLDLKKADILGSKQGKGGGYYLKKDPREISLLDVVTVIDGGYLLFSTLSSQKTECAVCKTNCALHETFSAAEDYTISLLSHTSIFDFIGRNVPIS